MFSPASILAVTAFALGVVEAAAYWWMHPAPAGLDQPVLSYIPGSGSQTSISAERSTESKSSPSTSSSSPATINPQLSTAPPSIDHQSSFIDHRSSSSTTPLPEIYAQAAPMLRCSSGQVSRVRIDEALSLHIAFFEWDGTDTGSVLEAFRHLPESCMGSIGMILVSKEKPIRYRVGTETLLFDHTIFREPGPHGGLAALAPQIHAFRAIWVAGMAHPNARQGIGGDEFDHLRTIRLKSALTRFRPAHARVVQGAVRGSPTPEAAWQAFESAMLQDLTFQ